MLLCHLQGETKYNCSLQQITGMRQEVLYDIFVKLHKSYNALGMEQILMIIGGYKGDPPGP